MSRTMGDKTIRVSEDTWKDLKALKREGESFDDVIRRLTDDKWQGFGALADTGIREGMEQVHEQLGEGLAEDIEEMNH